MCEIWQVIFGWQKWNSNPDLKGDYSKYAFLIKGFENSHYCIKGIYKCFDFISVSGMFYDKTWTINFNGHQTWQNQTFNLNRYFFCYKFSFNVRNKIREFLYFDIAGPFKAYTILWLFACSVYFISHGPTVRQAHKPQTAGPLFTSHGHTGRQA